MSVRWITWAWGQKCTNAAEKLTLVALADHCGEDGTAFPGAGRLADKTGSSERTVRRHLDQLETDGKLTRQRRRRRDGTMGTYTYTLVEEPPDNLTAGQSDRRSPSASPADIAVSAGPPDTDVRAEPSALFEPSEEPSDDNVVAIDVLSFDAFWSAYPNKKGKGEARGVFDKLSKRDRADAIIGARRHAQCMDDHPGRFIMPQGPVWLTKRRWEDDEPLSPPPRRGDNPYIDIYQQLQEEQ